MGKVVSFVNNKGGVGKTTSACSIGLAWARMGKKVLFIDLDSQANLTSQLSKTDAASQRWERTLEDAFIEGPDEGLPIMHTDNPLVDYVPTDLDLANFDKDTARVAFKELLLLDLVQKVKDSYDFIVIDCPPSLSVITYNAMIASDFLVLVTHPEGSSCKGLEMIVRLYNEIISNRRFNPDLVIIGCLITKVERDNISGYQIKKLKETFGNIILEPYIPKSTKVSQATSFNRDIYEIEPRGKVADAYLKVSQELLVRIVDACAEKSNE